MSLLTIRIEGGLLSPDFLESVHDQPGQKPADFGLEDRRPLIDEITAVWSDVRTYWEAFERRRARAKDGESLTTATREAWVIPLLEALGYELTFQRRAAVADGRSFAISHRAGANTADVAGGPPVHIVAFDQKLGERPPSGHGTASPHALVQDYLNRSEDLWGVVTNGAVLRLLRDSVYFSRPAYIEFDLQAMMAGERLDEFILFYRLVHRTRLPKGERSDDCLLEQYYQGAVEQGGRIRDGLRQAVEGAILTLANGFLGHPKNEPLRQVLAVGTLSPNAFYQQLLYLIYRLIFLMAAEERNLLRLAPDAQSPISESPIFQPPNLSISNDHYATHYSITRLRRLAEAPLNAPQRFDDLFLGLRTLFAILRDERWAPLLEIPALNGELFDATRMGDLEAAHLNNHDLLAAIGQLSYFTPANEKVRRRVNYAALDVEELGSVYESLLDEHPVVNLAPNRRARFEFVHGSERKTTGSYYTPRELVKETLDAALDPVIEARLKAAAEGLRRAPAEQVRRAQIDALLNLRVCDSACGSGHFLLAAARRIGRVLAQLDTGDDEPAPEAVRHWTREAIIHCIYGVDKNPLAVDLCKVALWVEGHAPGKPLTFLDAHIKCGDALVGVFDLAVLEQGIPDDAFKAVTGDDKPTASAVRRRNKQERAGQMVAESAVDRRTFDQAVTRWQAQLAAPEDTPAQVREKRSAYAALQQQERSERLACDLWTAAFFTPLTPENDAAGRIVTSGTLAAYLATPQAVNPTLAGFVQATAQRNQFFHWPLEFPHIFAAGGFDVMLGNPPWERIKLQEQEFFAALDPEIADAANKAARQKLIDALPQTNPALAAAFAEAKYAAEAQSRFVRGAGRFPLTAVGDVNTYALFAELARNLLMKTGRAGIIVPTGIATDDTTKRFFADLMQRHALSRFIGFENEAQIFPAVHHAFKFCIVAITGVAIEIMEADFVFFCRYMSDVQDAIRRFTVTNDDVALINPNTRTGPVFRNRHDAELTKQIYRRVPVLVNEAIELNPWNLRFQRMMDMANDSSLFSACPGPNLVALYEGKMVWQYDHRFGSFAGRMERGFTNLDEVPSEYHCDPVWQPAPYYWVPESEISGRIDDFGKKWFLVYRRITNATNERTTIGCIVPFFGMVDGLPVFVSQRRGTEFALLCGNLNHLCLDFVVRQKIGGLHLDFHQLKQVPILPPSSYTSSDRSNIVPRVLELTYTAWDLAPFAADLWADAGDDLRSYLLAQHAENRAATGGHPWAPPAWANLPPEPPESCPLSPFKWDDERRALLRAELDAYYARLYGLTRDELRYILDPKEVYGPDFPGETFRVLKEKEEKQFGEYRTRRLVLAAWDRLEAELGPVVVRNYREELAAAQPRLAEEQATYAAETPARPQFGVTPAPKAGSSAAPPPVGQPDLFGNAPAAAATAPTKPASDAAPATAKPAAPAQPVLIPAPPQGPRLQRLNRLLAISKEQTPAAIGELVAALGDEDEQLRWLASMALQRIGGPVVVATLERFVASGVGDVARGEAERLLEVLK